MLPSFPSSSARSPTVVAKGTKLWLAKPAHLVATGFPWIPVTTISIQDVIDQAGLGSDQIRLELAQDVDHPYLSSTSLASLFEGKQQSPRLTILDNGNVQISIGKDQIGGPALQIGGPVPQPTPRKPLAAMCAYPGNRIPGTPQASSGALSRVPGTPRTPSGPSRTWGTPHTSGGPPLELYLRDPTDALSLSDLKNLSSVNEANMLHILSQRYASNLTGTEAAHSLIIINPKRDLGDSTDERKRQYHVEALDALSSCHVYAVAKRKLEGVRLGLQHQFIAITGNSGAGKSRTCQEILNFIAVDGTNQLMNDVNRILEAVGNAQTEKNSNSSRVGKLVSVRLTKSAKVVGTTITTYLLERTRVTRQSPNERNFHIFYYLFAGLGGHSAYGFDLPNSKKLSECFPYLSGQLLPGDQGHLHELEAAFERIGLVQADRDGMYATLAGILQLGCVRVSAVQADPALHKAATLLGIPEDRLRSFLFSKSMPGGGSIGRATAEVRLTRDGIAQTLYSNLFEWLVAKCNVALNADAKAGFMDAPSDGATSTLDILDMFGFENFQSNSLEQFCINLANENLQDVFMQIGVKRALDEFRQEGIQVEAYAPASSETCKDAMNDVCALLDDSKSTDSNDQNFEAKVRRSTSASVQTFTQLLPTAPGRSCRMRLSHYAGVVDYDTVDFVAKNGSISDGEKGQLIALLAQSSLEVVAVMASGMQNAHARPGKRATTTHTLRKSLLSLLDLLKKSDSTAWIRCISPNAERDRSDFDVDYVRAQIKAAGILPSIQLLAVPYPASLRFDSFMTTFASSYDVSATPSPAQQCRVVLDELKLSRADYHIGVTKVFFTSSALGRLNAIVLERERQREERLLQEAAALKAAEDRRIEAAAAVKVAEEKRIDDEAVLAAKQAAEDRCDHVPAVQAEASTGQLDGGSESVLKPRAKADHGSLGLVVPTARHGLECVPVGQICRGPGDDYEDLLRPDESFDQAKKAQSESGFVREMLDLLVELRDSNIEATADYQRCQEQAVADRVALQKHQAAAAAETEAVHRQAERAQAQERLGVKRLKVYSILVDHHAAQRDLEAVAVMSGDIGGADGLALAMQAFVAACNLLDAGMERLPNGKERLSTAITQHIAAIANKVVDKADQMANKSDRMRELVFWLGEFCLIHQQLPSQDHPVSISIRAAVGTLWQAFCHRLEGMVQALAQRAFGRPNVDQRSDDKLIHLVQYIGVVCRGEQQPRSAAFAKQFRKPVRARLFCALDSTIAQLSREAHNLNGNHGRMVAFWKDALIAEFFCVRSDKLLSLSGERDPSSISAGAFSDHWDVSQYDESDLLGPQLGTAATATIPAESIFAFDLSSDNNKLLQDMPWCAELVRACQIEDAISMDDVV